MPAKTKPTKIEYPAQLYAAVVVVIVLSLMAAMNFLASIKTYDQGQPDPYQVASQEARFQPLLDRVPPNAVVGYFSDLSLDNNAGLGAYFVAQYWLAPRLLVPVTTAAWHEWAIGNFSKKLDAPAAGVPYQLNEVQDTGAGVILYRR